MFLLTYINMGIASNCGAMWSAASKDFKTIYGISTSKIAMVNTFAASANCLSEITFGRFADKYKAKTTLLIFYSSLALVNICIGLMMFIPAEKQESYIWVYVILRMLNSLTKSTAFPVNIVVLCRWLPKKTSKGLLLGLWASCTGLGDLLGA